MKIRQFHEILPFKSKLFKALNKRGQTFMHTNFFEAKLKKFKTRMIFFNNQYTDFFGEKEEVVTR